MQTKLTLRLDEELVVFGKQWAKQQGKSLSQLIAEYLSTLEKLPYEHEQLPPITQELFGIARDVDQDVYHRYIEEKYR